MRLKIFPYLLILFGTVLVILSVRGIFINELPFIARDDSYFLIVKHENENIFWFLEAFYFFGGIATAVFGVRETRENKKILK